MSYVALYRKFRPSKFSEVKGQEHVVKTLKNQIENNRIGHAYLFTGTRGTGKTSVAKLFAKAANCENPVNGDPCGECPSCQAIQKNVSLNVIEIDAASNNRVDDVRQIIEEVQYSPVEGKYKIYIIDEVHMLSIGAFNALLKTLEEPPSYAIFILATTEVNKLPITILSRCQRYDFRRIGIDTIAARMKELMAAENRQVEEKALNYIAKVADGSLRDALSLLDRCIAFYFDGMLTYEKTLEVLGAVDTTIFSEMLKMIVEKNTLGCISKLKDIMMLGKEVGQFVNDFSWYLRNVLIVKTSPAVSEEMLEMSSENVEQLKKEAEMLTEEEIIRYINIFSELSGQIKNSSQKQILTEIALVKLTRPQMDNSYEGLIERITNLEDKLEKGNFTVTNTAVNTAASKSTVDEKPLKELEIAVPEDVIWMANNSARMLKAVAQPYRTLIAQHGRISSDGGNKLLIVIPEKIGVPMDMKNAAKAVEEAIGKTIEKKVEVEIRILNNGDNYNEKYKEISKINMEIVEE